METMAVDSSFSIMALIVLAFVGLLLLGGLAAIIALLINPNTRVVGIVLLAIVVLAVALVGGVAFYFMLDGRPPAISTATAVEHVGQSSYHAAAEREAGTSPSPQRQGQGVLVATSQSPFPLTYSV